MCQSCSTSTDRTARSSAMKFDPLFAHVARFIVAGFGPDTESVLRKPAMAPGTAHRYRSSSASSTNHEPGGLRLEGEGAGRAASSPSINLQAPGDATIPAVSSSPWMARRRCRRRAGPDAGRSFLGPLVFERIESHFVVAPEYKYTELDGRAGHMAGFSAGVLNDKSLYIGGAIYFLANGSDAFGLTYGGLLTGMTVPVGSHLRVGGRALFGFGEATIGDSYATYDPHRRVTRNYLYIVHQDFALAEPQAQAHISFADHVGVDVTAGYRFAGWDEYAHNGVDGVTGAVAAQIGL